MKEITLGTKIHYPLVLVTWVDSTTYPGWQGLDKAWTALPYEIQSTGFIIRNDDTFLTLAMSLSDHDTGEMGALDTLVLPKGCVMRVEPLGLVSSCGCGEVSDQAECVDESCGKDHKVTCVGEEDPYGWNLCKYNENCGFCEEEVRKEKAEEDCWGAPDLDNFCPDCGMGVCICDLTDQEVRELTVPLEVIKGDEVLGRQLTLDEYIRRGGNYATWPGLTENIEGVE